MPSPPWPKSSTSPVPPTVKTSQAARRNRPRFQSRHPGKRCSLQHTLSDVPCLGKDSNTGSHRIGSQIGEKRTTGRTWSKKKAGRSNMWIVPPDEAVRNVGPRLAAGKCGSEPPGNQQGFERLSPERRPLQTLPWEETLEGTEITPIFASVMPTRLIKKTQ